MRVGLGRGCFNNGRAERVLVSPLREANRFPLRGK